ncbi:MAG: FAD-dependent oxidoreductase [Planctomycetes bacterium]|nr:FAD-dependent oxidoreductase [Planctomycetota bacterium]
MRPEDLAMTTVQASVEPHVVVVGGGLAGLAAAAALAEARCRVTLVEARRRCGGRAASFDDPVGGGLVDACQHVAMGCCTNFLDLCRWGGLDDAIRRDRTLWFIGPDGHRSRCTPTRLLPAPLHLAPLLFGMRHFSLGEKGALARGMLRLARHRARAAAGSATALAWLRTEGRQPERVIRLFWQPVIESALGESIDLVSVAAARQVAVDGFLGHRHAADLIVPTEPLGRLFGERFVGRLRAAGVQVVTGAQVSAIERTADGAVVAIQHGTERLPCAAAIVAVPWKAAGRLVPDAIPAGDEQLAGSPISAVHLWFDRDVLDVPHAVLVGRVSQWVFRGDPREDSGHCQVVISASRGLLAEGRDSLVERVVAELRDVFPAAGQAKLREAKVVTDPTAVLSVRPGVESLRPKAPTAVPNLFLAGDWTATGWPSTMEGAIRSGRSAAAAAGGHLGLEVAGPSPGLPKNMLVRLLAAP